MKTEEILKNVNNAKKTAFDEAVERGFFLFAVLLFSNKFAIMFWKKSCKEGNALL